MTTNTRPAKSGGKRPTTKKAQLITMLSAKAGVDVEAISNKLGWQRHTTRAAITGLKKAGYMVSAEKEVGKTTRYRIAADSKGAGVDGQKPTIETSAAPVPANAG
ncbi:DUF3489 domain-containing protein [Ovoidimarina sediminis]|uniref:DUF3489 domain-containing protein n=1 Tax=Ovoidimarina sediminis TaxID=3079856 RepID=UPI0029126D6E|nr:DUF3489 domain-containing protein [Rhodophyticola sp. MJ-SS7]MDU8945998.1 DUF3489 domain-containing protein [Rhodophyticola sp. MJ-SS7]